jgi:hypothetical protein
MKHGYTGIALRLLPFLPLLPFSLDQKRMVTLLNARNTPPQACSLTNNSHSHPLLALLTTPLQVFAHLESGQGEKVVRTSEDGNVVECGSARCQFDAVFTDATQPGAESVYATASHHSALNDLGIITACPPTHTHTPLHLPLLAPRLAPWPHGDSNS